MDDLAQTGQPDLAQLVAELRAAREACEAATVQLMEKKDTTSTVILAAFVAGVLAIVGTVVQGVQTGRLEETKFRSSLVLKAVEARTREEAAQTLNFFVRAGLLEDRDGFIASLVKKPSEVPRLSALNAGGSVLINVDVDKYCRETMGSEFRAVDGHCTDGTTRREIDPKDACKRLTGSDVIIYNSATGLHECLGGRSQRGSP
jgi:hypothetical protein